MNTSFLYHALGVREQERSRVRYEDNVSWTLIGRFGFTNQDAALEYYVK